MLSDADTRQTYFRSRDICKAPFVSIQNGVESITPPLEPEERKGQDDNILSTAVHVLSVEATSLSYLSRLYATNPIARHGFTQAARNIRNSLENHGKIVVCGVGKSGKIGQKLVATFNSLGLCSVFLHPTEAVHGDMGILRPMDVLLILTFSGKTPELINLLSNLPFEIPVIAMTAQTTPTACPLSTTCSNFTLLPAPIHEPEMQSFGISAPTTSTTVALALGDALALAIAKDLHTSQNQRTEDIFRSFHPGGAIGMNNKKRLRDVAVPYDDMPMVDQEPDCLPLGTVPTTSVTVLDCIMKTLTTPNAWLRLSDGSVITPSRLKSVTKKDMALTVQQAGISVPRCKWIPLDGEMAMMDAKSWAKRGDVLLVKLPGRRYGLLEGDDVLEVK